MNPFDILMRDLFSSKDFSERCTFRGVTVSCLVSEISATESYERFGTMPEVSFTLQIPNTGPMPKRGERLMYRGETYKVASAVLDSTGKTYRIFLRDADGK